MRHKESALPLLKALNNCHRFKLPAAGDIMFHVLDRDETGWTLPPLTSELGLSYSTLIDAFKIMGAHGCIERQRAKDVGPTSIWKPGRGGPPYVYTARPLLTTLAESYNDVTAETIADYAPTDALAQPGDVRTRAIAHLALGYGLGRRFTSESAVLDAASERGMGHPQSVLQHALQSVALMHSMTYKRFAEGMEEKVASYS